VYTLTSDQLAVTVDLDRGCELVQITHRRSSARLLLDTGAAGRPEYGASYHDWITAYRGGWQLMVPNAGAQCQVGDVEWGFHGEASTRVWELIEARAASLVAEVELTTVALQLRRTIEVNGDQVVVTDAIRNRGDRRVEFLWGHHPAFGGDLVAGSPRLITNAARATIDAASREQFDRPVVSSGSWPHVGRLDLSRFPVISDGSIVFYLSEFPAAAMLGLVNDEIGLQAVLHWAARDFTCAWVWQELSDAHEFPLFAPVRTCGLEPVSSYPAVGAREQSAAGGSLIAMGPGASSSRSVVLSVRATAGEPGRDR
jgi:hypothetical protein